MFWFVLSAALNAACCRPAGTGTAALTTLSVCKAAYNELYELQIKRKGYTFLGNNPGIVPPYKGHPVRWLLSGAKERTQCELRQSVKVSMMRSCRTTIFWPNVISRSPKR